MGREGTQQLRNREDTHGNKCFRHREWFEKFVYQGERTRHQLDVVSAAHLHAQVMMMGMSKVVQNEVGVDGNVVREQRCLYARK